MFMTRPHRVLSMLRFCILAIYFIGKHGLCCPIYLKYTDNFGMHHKIPNMLYVVGVAAKLPC